MSNHVQLEVWFQEDKLNALSSVLEEQGTTVEKRMQEMLIDLYTELVPYEVQQELRARMDAEHTAAQAEAEAARKYTAFCVRENGTQSFFQLDRSESILEVSKFLRRYVREGQGQGTTALQTSAFARMEPVTAERYDQLLALRMEAPDKVTGVFDLDFDRREVSTVDAADGWKTWSMQDVSTAVFHAYRKSCLRPEQYMSRFLEKLEGRELTSPGHLQEQTGQTLADYSAPCAARPNRAASTPTSTETPPCGAVWRREPRGRFFCWIKAGGRFRARPPSTPPRNAGRGRRRGGRFGPLLAVTGGRK